MIVEVNTDRNIEGHERLQAYVESTVARSLRRFSDNVTRVVVHLRDENGDKNAPNDKRCNMEARAEGMNPIGVSHDASHIEQAVSGAAEKMRNALTSALEKRRTH